MTTLFGETAQTMWQKVMFARSFNAMEATDADWYAMLEAYYLNNALYEGANFILKEVGVWMEGMLPLRNPVNRTVEFHVSHLWPGALTEALPIVSKNEKLAHAVQKVWQWSNFGVTKQLGARWFAEFGNVFIKVATKSDALKKVQKIVESWIKPKNVIAFELDEYGFITYIRIDVPSTRNVNGKVESYTHTEIWDKDSKTYTVYEHQFGQGALITNMGNPKTVKPFDEFKIDFIPIVHAKFRDTGNDRGDAAFVHALDKIDEANRMATRLHNLLFRYNKPVEVITAGGNDASGKPLPPPKLTDGDGNEIKSKEDWMETDRDVMKLPGSADVKQLVPALAYAEALSILNAQMEELEQDLPEMTYYKMKDKGDLSGRAVRLMLSDAIDRAIEARGNGETAIVRANQIALTLGTKHNLKDFNGIGAYESGAFDHSFARREIIPVSELERAETLNSMVIAGLDILFAMKQNGYSAAEITEFAHSPKYLADLQKISDDTGVTMETLLLQSSWTEEEIGKLALQSSQTASQSDSTANPAAG